MTSNLYDANTYTPKPLVFAGEDGTEIPIWQVPLDDYIKAQEQYARTHEGYTNNWVLAHRLVIARALIHDCDVPAEVLAQEDAAELDRLIERERRLHAQGRTYCPECGHGGSDER